MAKETVYELVPWNSHRPAFRLDAEELRAYILHDEMLVESKPTAYFDGVEAAWGLFPTKLSPLEIFEEVVSGSVLYGNTDYQFRARHPFFSGRWWRSKLTN